MLKYDFRKHQLTFMEGIQLDQHMLLEDEPDEPELCAGGVQPLAQDEVVDTLIACAGHEEGDQLLSDIILINF